MRMPRISPGPAAEKEISVSARGYVSVDGYRSRQRPCLSIVLTRELVY